MRLLFEGSSKGSECVVTAAPPTASAMPGTASATGSRAMAIVRPVTALCIAWVRVPTVAPVAASTTGEPLGGGAASGESNSRPKILNRSAPFSRWCASQPR